MHRVEDRYTRTLADIIHALEDVDTLIGRMLVWRASPPEDRKTLSQYIPETQSNHDESTFMDSYIDELIQTHGPLPE